MITIDKALIAQTLQNSFGFSAFRHGQEEIVEAILTGEHVLAVMPTGAGKSLCFQLPAVIQKTKTIVVSPLVALMSDQVAALKDNGIAAEMLHSGRLYDDNVISWRRFASDDTKILYLSPERLMQPRMIAALQKLPIGLFVIDEAHCISKWGAGFRPDYEALCGLQDAFPQAQIAAFTATADSATRRDISDKLTKGQSRQILHGFDRPNLSLAVHPKKTIKDQLLAFVKARSGHSGIIYCLSRRETDEVAEFLCQKGVNAMAYHAGKDQDYRASCQNRFMSEADMVMVATIAFGMGIDKPDIRYVIHASLPASVEAFYQEIGRAGRDGVPAETLLLYSLQDMIKRQRMIFESDGNDSYKFGEYTRLEALIGYCEATGCRRQALLAYFDESISACGNCDNCLNPPEVVDYSTEAGFVIEAIYQTGQFFGVSHIIDVVQGAQTSKVKEKNHDSLTSFGKGKGRSKGFYQSLVRQLVARQIIVVNLERYGALHLSDAADEILAGRAPFRAGAFVEKERGGAKSRAAKPLAVNAEDAGLLGQLKALRLRLAQEKNVPAYVIFPDRALHEIAAHKPTSKEAFLAVNGVGPKKVEAYFEAFHDVISRYLSHY